MHPGSLKPARGSTRRGRYLGRGRASGHGKTSGRGQKGQFSRTGARRRPGFVGGDLPLMLKIPKRGFVSPFKIRYRLVNLASLERAFEANAEVTVEALVGKGIVATPRSAVKVLGDGEITKALNVKCHAFSESAKRKIAAAGGTTTVVEYRIRERSGVSE